MPIQHPYLTDLYTTTIGCAWVRSGIRVTHLSAKLPGRGVAEMRADGRCGIRLAPRPYLKYSDRALPPMT